MAANLSGMQKLTVQHSCHIQFNVFMYSPNGFIFKFKQIDLLQIEIENFFSVLVFLLQLLSSQFNIEITLHVCWT